jgi:AraC-like DNA-binding protein
MSAPGSVVRRPDQPRPALIRTRDFDEAHDVIAAAYVPHKLESRDGMPLNFKFNFLQSHGLTIGHLNYGADAELVVPAMQRHYHLNLTLKGVSLVTQTGRRATSSAMRHGVVIRPFDDFTVRWSPEATQYAVLLPSDTVENHLKSLLSHPVDGPIDFALSFDLANNTGQGLLAAIHFLRCELARPGGIAESPIARSQLESFAITQLLLAVPHRYSEELSAPTRPANRNRIRNVIDLIDSQPASDLSIARLAEVAGVSGRALQVGFRQAVGMTPVAYVRKVRLDRVREELIALAGERSITETALYWGFTHLGRFSVYYKQQFGESPTETVRNALRG